MLKAVAVAMLFVLVNCSDKDSSDVNYDKQNEWTGTCNLAESKKQSPVDVITPQSSSKLDGKFVDLSSGDGLTASNANDRSGIKITFDKKITYKIPGLDKTEGTVAQLHIHWGSKDSEGSEHLLDGKQYALEAHLVTSYGSDGKYAVVNRFFKIGNENAQIGKMITSAKATGKDRAIADFNLTAIYPSDIKEVITYEGGLTTPGCDEIVHWIIVPEPLTVSSEQVASLRLVKLGDGTADAKTFNWRNKQALNGRTFKLWKTSSSASLAAFISPPILLLAVLVNFFH